MCIAWGWTIDVLWGRGGRGVHVWNAKWIEDFKIWKIKTKKINKLITDTVLKIPTAIS